ncbi:MAG: zinc-finger-containing protein [Anaeroplasma sp.]
MADDEKKILKNKCHELFDMLWYTKAGRTRKYIRLAKELGIPVKDCHFSMMDERTLRRAYEILCRWVAYSSKRRR